MIRGGAKISEGIAKAGLLCTSVVPFVLVPGVFFPFVVTRNIFFRLVVELAVGLVFFTGMKSLRAIRMRRDSILLFLLAFLFAISLAALFGVSPWHSLFGDFERMGGVWAWLHLILFYVLMRILFSERDWFFFFRGTLGVAGLVVLWGLGGYLPATLRNPNFRTPLWAGSTIGNEGLLAPYLLLAVFIALWLVVMERSKLWKSYAALTGALCLVGMVGSRNRSSQLGFLIGIAVALGVFYLFHSERKKLVRAYFLAGFAFVLALAPTAYLLRNRAPALVHALGGRWNSVSGTYSSHARPVEWRIALRGFFDRPVLGYGPENHQIVVSHHFDPEMYALLGDQTFDRTHNVWLELLATTGIIGTLAMIAVWLAAAQALGKGAREGVLAAKETAVLAGALAAYSVYLTFWFFDINSVMVWIALLAFISFRLNGRLDVFADAEAAGESRMPRPLAWAMIALVALSGYLHGIVPYRVAGDLNRAISGGPFEERLQAFTYAMNSAAPQTLHTFPLYSRFLKSSAPRILAPGVNPFFRKSFDLAMQRGALEAERSISRNSQDDRSYVEAARFYSFAAAVYQDPRLVTKARQLLERAIRISPRRADSRLLLSNLLFALNDSAGARAQLDSAVRYAPQWYYYAARFALTKNHPDSAAAYLHLTLEHHFTGDGTATAETAEQLDSLGNPALAATTVREYLEASQGGMASWGDKSNAHSSWSTMNDSLANHLALLYVRSGEGEMAIKAADAYAKLHPAATPAAESLQLAVKSGDLSSWKRRTLLLTTQGLGSSH